MESITFELCSSPTDPSDRTLGILARTGGVTLLAAACRPLPSVPLGELLVWVDRFALAWSQPSMHEDSTLWDLYDEMVRSIGDPF